MAKRWLSGLVVLGVLAVSNGVAMSQEAIPAEREKSLTLENHILRLEIQTSHAPFLQRLVHKASGQAVVAEPAHKSLFSIVLAAQDGSQVTVDSVLASESSVTVSSTDRGSQMAIQYAKFPDLNLSVEVTVVCAASEPLTLWSLRIENDTGRRIRAVRFPQFLAVPAIGDGKDDCLVLPALAGTLIENPAETWRNGQSVTLSYPGNLSAQFLAYQDRSAGVYLAGMDPAGYPMSLAVLKQAEGFRCWHEFTPVPDGKNGSAGAAEPGKNWASPYPVALGVTQGTWCDTADQYKQWAVRQTWCAAAIGRAGRHPCLVEGRSGCACVGSPHLRQHTDLHRIVLSSVAGPPSHIP